MYVLRTRYPYMGSIRIPLNYYSLLYTQLEAIWKELIMFLDENGVEYEKNMHNLELRVPGEIVVEVLTRLHQSFMRVEGYYDGEKLERRLFLKHLWEEYNPSMISALEGLIDSINRKNYHEGYRHAVSALEAISAAEAAHAITGGRINQLLFNMLHGSIPQTYTNTYLLVEHGSELTRRIASRVYESVREDAEKVLTVLKVNKLVIGGRGKR